MNKRQVSKYIDWRKNMFKRLICKHEYQGYNLQGSLRGEYHTEICKKCGKVKYKPVFWEYEGMGFK